MVLKMGEIEITIPPSLLRKFRTRYKKDGFTDDSKAVEHLIRQYLNS